MKIDVIDVVDQPDGSAELHIDFDEEFKEWFKSSEGLKRFSQKRFEKFVLNALRAGHGLEQEK